MVDRTKNSRLTEIFEAQRRKGKGTLGALTGSIGGRVRESLDIRNLLFGPAYKSPKSFTQALGRSIFGTGYSAGGRRTDRGIGSSFEGSQKMVESLNALNSGIGSIDRKMTALVKNSLQQNKVARDVNVIRQNVVKITKQTTGKAATSADMFFMRAKQREKEYEKQFGDEDLKNAEKKNAPKNKKSGISGILSSAGSLLKFMGIGAGIGALIVGVFSLVKNFKEQYEKLKEFLTPEGIKKFFDSFSAKDINKFVSDTFNSLTSAFTTIFEGIKGFVSKIDSKTIGNIMKTITDGLISTVTWIWEQLKRGFDTLSTEDKMKVLGLAGLGAAIMAPRGVIAALGALASVTFSLVSAFGSLVAAIGGLIGDALSGDGVDIPGEDGKRKKKRPRGRRSRPRISKRPPKRLPKFPSGAAVPLAVGAAGAAAGYATAEAFSEAEERSAEKTRGIVDRNEATRLADESRAVGGLQRLFPGRTAEELQLGIKSLTPAELTKLNGDILALDGLKSKEDEKARKTIEDKIKERFKTFQGSSNEGYNPRTGKFEPIRETRKPVKPQTEVQKVTSGDSGELTQWEKDFDAKIERNKEKAQRVSSTSVSLPTNLDFDAYKSKVGYFESRGNYSQPPNKFGYVGKYQFGAQALETLGYLKTGSYAKYKNKALLDSSNWNHGLSLESFLASPQVQDEAFAKLTKMNYDILKNKGIVNDKMSSDELSGFLYVAHGVGAGGAIKFAQGENPSEGFGTTAKQMFAKASGQAPPNIPSGPGMQGGVMVAGASPKMSGEMFASPFGNEMKAFGDSIVNVINNTMTKGNEAVSEALSSVDMDTVKEMFNPMIARATYGFTI